MSAKVTKAAIILADAADKVVELNGTPFGQNITQIYPQMRAIDPMRGIGFERLDDWRERYAVCVDMPVGRYTIRKPVGIRDAPGLMRRIEPFFFRATKATSLDLPEKLKPVTIELSLPKAVAELYKLVERDGDAVFDPLSLNGDRVGALRLQQIVSGTCPRIISEDGIALGPWVTSKLHAGITLPSPKRDWCVEWAREQLAGNPSYRAIVWLKYTASILELEIAMTHELGPGRVVAVTGATDDITLEQWKSSFNSRDPNGVQVIVAQTAKLAYGANLQACDMNVLYDHSWRYLERDQLEDRSHRMGRVGPVGYIELVTTVNGKPTIDAAALEAFRRREDMVERFAQDTTGMQNYD